MTTFAYIRVSTEGKGQTTDNQRKLILDAGFQVDEFISEEGVSGSRKAFERPAFAAMLSRMNKDDTVLVTAIDRLGRSASDVLNVVEELKARGIRVKVTQFDGIDLTSATGKLMLTMLAAVAEMERNLLIERTNAGLARTKAQGTKLGAPLTITPTILKELIDKKADGATFDELQTEYNIPRNTIARNISKWKGNFDAYALEWEARQSQYAAKAV